MKKDLVFGRDMTDMMETLKGVAVKEFKALEQRRERFARFMKAFRGFFQMVDYSRVDHPFVAARGRLAILVITSDGGFMGGLNARVIQAALRHPRIVEADLMVIGNRGAQYLRGAGYDLARVFPGIVSEDRFEGVRNLKEYVLEKSLKGEMGRLLIVYPRPVSFFVQEVETLTLLPCHELFEGGEVLEPSAWGVKRRLLSLIPGVEERVIVDSPLAKIVEYLVETWLTQKLFEVFDDSKLAELAARAVYLQEGQQKLEDKMRLQRYRYLRVKREMVDRELRDMFSARAARAGR